MLKRATTRTENNLKAYRERFCTCKHTAKSSERKEEVIEEHHLEEDASLLSRDSKTKAEDLFWIKFDFW